MPLNQTTPRPKKEDVDLGNIFNTQLNGASSEGKEPTGFSSQEALKRLKEIHESTARAQNDFDVENDNFTAVISKHLDERTRSLAQIEDELKQPKPATWQSMTGDILGLLAPLAFALNPQIGVGFAALGGTVKRVDPIARRDEEKKQYLKELYARSQEFGKDSLDLISTDITARRNVAKEKLDAVIASGTSEANLLQQLTASASESEANRANTTSLEKGRIESNELIANLSRESAERQSASEASTREKIADADNKTQIAIAEMRKSIEAGNLRQAQNFGKFAFENKANSVAMQIMVDEDGDNIDLSEVPEAEIEAKINAAYNELITGIDKDAVTISPEEFKLIIINKMESRKKADFDKTDMGKTFSQLDATNERMEKSAVEEEAILKELKKRLNQDK